MHEKVTDKLLTLDEALKPTLPAFLMLLDVPVEDPQWQALDPRQRRQRTLDAVKRLLLRESQVQPLLVIVENLHWIDTETQAVLDSLIESLPTAQTPPPRQLPALSTSMAGGTRLTIPSSGSIPCHLRAPRNSSKPFSVTTPASNRSSSA